MRLWRIIAVATAAELSFAVAALALLGLVGGAVSGWLDLVNQLALIGLFASLLALALVRLTTPPGGARRLLLAAAGIGALGAGLLMAPDLLAAAAGLAARPAAGGRPFTVVQFNIWRENVAVAEAARVLAAADPDVLAVEEVDGFSARRLAPLTQRFPYRTTCRTDWSCGLILYSKTAPLAVEDLSGRRPDSGAELGLLKATFRGPGGAPLTLLAVHLAWPMPPGAQAEQLARLAAAVKGAGTTGVMVVGDFNLTPWSYALRRVDAALAPLQRRTHGLATYPATIPRARLPWPAPFLPIDQVYASPDLEVTGVHTLPRAGSDHYPVAMTVSR